MSDIVIAGNTYTNVPQIIVPKVGGGSALFTDVSDTTAAAADVASGKYFYTAAGVKTAGTASGGGGTSPVPLILRPDATVVQTWTYDKKIVADLGLSVPSYSTSSTNLVAASNLSPTITVDTANYDYYVLHRCLSYPIYDNNTAQAGRQSIAYTSYTWEIVSLEVGAYSDCGISFGTRRIATRNSALNFYVYFSSATKLVSAESASYGFVIAPSTPAAIGTNSQFTLKSPVLKFCGNSTYMSSSALSHVTDARYQWIIEVYRAPKGATYGDGWQLAQGAKHILDCAKTQSRTLT